MKKLLALVIASVTLLGACANPSPSPSAPASGNATNSGTATNAPAKTAEIKDTLIWAQGADVTSFDPNQGKETLAIQVHGNIYDTLLTVNDKMEVQPMLAEKYERTSDLEYVFNLRKGVKFHDGSDFTAADVKFSLDRAIANPSCAYIIDFVQEVIIVDDYTVKLVTKAPYAPTFLNLAHPAIGMMSKAYLEKDPEILKTKPMGTGPYKFVEWKQQSYVKLERFDDYWAGPAKTKYIEMRVIPENAQRTIALELGEVDVAYDILPNDISKIKANDKLQMFEKPALTAFFMTMNMSRPILENPKVREAIRLALDPKPMVEQIYYGAGSVANSIIPPGAFGHNDKLPEIETNIEKAKKALADAGYANGVKLTLIVNDNQIRVECCQVIQAQLKQIGIDVDLQVLEFGAFIDKFNSQDCDLAYSGWTTSTADCDYTYFAQFHSSKFGSQGNRTWKEIPGANALLEAGRASADPAKRMESYTALEKLLTENFVHRPLFYTTVNAGASKNVQDFIVIPNAYHKFWQVSVLK